MNFSLSCFMVISKVIIKYFSFTDILCLFLLLLVLFSLPFFLPHFFSIFFHIFKTWLLVYVCVNVCLCSVCVCVSIYLCGLEKGIRLHGVGIRIGCDHYDLGDIKKLQFFGRATSETTLWFIIIIYYLSYYQNVFLLNVYQVPNSMLSRCFMPLLYIHQEL